MQPPEKLASLGTIAAISRHPEGFRRIIPRDLGLELNPTAPMMPREVSFEGNLAKKKGFGPAGWIPRAFLPHDSEEKIRCEVSGQAIYWALFIYLFNHRCFINKYDTYSISMYNSSMIK